MLHCSHARFLTGRVIYTEFDAELACSLTTGMLEEYPSPKGETMCPEEDDDGDKDDPRSMGLPIADELGDNELLGPAARL